MTNKGSTSEIRLAPYCDSLRLLLQFMQLHLRKEVSELDITDIDTSLVCAFLDDMENREISASSRNLRLVARARLLPIRPPCDS